MEKIVGCRRGTTKGDKNHTFKARRNPGSHCSDNGYVLIFVLWAVVILGFVASSFSASTRNAIKLEKATVERTKNLYATRGAAIYAMNKVAGVSEDDDEEWDDDEDWDDDEEFDDEDYEDEEDSIVGKDSETLGKDKGLSDSSDEEPEEPPWVPNTTPYSVFVGDKECKVYIEDESGKININAINDDSRELLVEYLIGQDFNRLEADSFTDSVLDWKDNDDLKHLNGAETHYYKSLPEPYEVKNANFDSTEELALIKGMTPAKYDRIRGNITVYGSSVAININFAPKEVIMAIPRITPQGAEYIIKHRKEKGPFQSMEDVKDFFWHLGIIGSSFEDIRPYITIDNSGYMTIRATCEANGISSSYRTIIDKVNNKISVYAVYPD